MCCAERRPRGSGRWWSRPIRMWSRPASRRPAGARGGGAPNTPRGPTALFGGSTSPTPRGAAPPSSICQADRPPPRHPAPPPPTGPLADPAVDIATLAAEIARAEERTDPNVVKLVGTPVAERRLRALYFTRAAAPAGEGPLYHHIGLYAFRRAALARFVSLRPSPLEQREKLEQLRALEAGMRIDATIVDSVPLGVDTPADLERARAILGRGK